MGKKGKKAAPKGTPDVVKFKGTRHFHLLRECVTIQESLPFVAVDALDELAFKKVARFLNMVGLLGEYLKLETSKDYRFQLHPKYLYPTPQFFPFGYDVEVIRSARNIQDRPSLRYNDISYEYQEDLRLKSEKYLKDVDSYMTKIASEIEPRLKDDFQYPAQGGLKRFKYELKENLEVFDALWIKYEEEYLKARLEILDQVFKPVETLITYEYRLSQAEERLDIPAKQEFERKFAQHVEEFTNTLFPETANEEFPEDVISLAEASIFYESKLTEDWLALVKHLIKDLLELRTYVAKIPEVRLNPELKNNQELMRLLQDFHASVVAARTPLSFVAKLPRIIDAKTDNWMTKKLLEPDLKYIQQTAQFAVEA